MQKDNLTWWPGCFSAGRNGGHIAPASWTSFPTLVSPLEEGGAGLTEEDALHILANEADTLQLAGEIIEVENLDVDLWKGFKLEGGCSGGAHEEHLRP
jgi:hypothetical protein